MVKSCRRYWTSEIADSIVQLKGVRFDNPMFSLTTSYNREDFTRLLTTQFGVTLEAVVSSFGIYPGPIAIFEDQEQHVHKLNQELRISSNPGSTVFGHALDWQGGAFFTRETTVLGQPVVVRSRSDYSTNLSPSIGGARSPRASRHARPRARKSAAHSNVVNNTSVPRMRYDYDYYADVLYGLPRTQTTPEVDRSALSTAYWGEGTGNFMMRSDWKTDATYAHFQCGRYDESHAHADQGSFMIFRNDWLAYDSLQRSLSGTEQFMSLHNLVRLNMPDGMEVSMMPNTQPCRVMALADNTRYSYMAADLTPVYSWRHGDYARHQNKQNDQVKAMFLDMVKDSEALGPKWDIGDVANVLTRHGVTL
mgnify:CR=1 FL=1